MAFNEHTDDCSTDDTVDTVVVTLITFSVPLNVSRLMTEAEGCCDDSLLSVLSVSCPEDNVLTVTV